MTTLRVHRLSVDDTPSAASRLRIHRFETVVTSPPATSTLRLHRFEVAVAQPLTANAGGNLLNQPPSWTIQLDGSLSTGSGTLTYEWSQQSGPTVTLSDTSDPNPTFQSPGLAAGAVLVFLLRVKDSTLTWSAYDQTTVSVDPQQHWLASGGSWVASALSAA